MKRFYSWLFHGLMGWKIEGVFPFEIKKFIIVVAPHSSNWDFIIGLLLRKIMGFKSNYLAKKELFQPPLGWLFYKLGGYPVDRSQSTHLVEQIVNIINNTDYFVTAIAPEGTRKNVKKWKTGFYAIAVQAQIPLVPVALNYKEKKVVWGLPFYPSGNLKEDAVKLDGFFKGHKGKYRYPSPVLGSN